MLAPFSSVYLYPSAAGVSEPTFSRSGDCNEE